MKSNSCSNIAAPAHAGALRDPGLPRLAAGICPLALLAITLFAAGSVGALGQGNVLTPGAETPATSPLMDSEVSRGSSTNGLNLNFRNAQIESVLAHLSDAGGFIISTETPVRGTVTVRGQNLTKEEAVNLLHSELSRLGYGAVRTGTRTLRIMTKDAIKSAGGTPVRTGNNPEEIPNNAEIATWIIPIRFVEAGQLVSDISPFVASQTQIIANQAGNSIIITDVQSRIRHLVEIIRSIDSSAEEITEVRVFHLRYADPTEMATHLTSLFPDSGGAQPPFRGGRGGRGGGGGGRGGGFGGFGGFGFGGFGGGNNNQNSQNDRIRRRNQVVAVADPRTQKITVTATRSVMEQIVDVVTELDQPGKQVSLAVLDVNNANATEIMQALQDVIGVGQRINNQQLQNDPFLQRQRQYNNGIGTSFGTTGQRRGGNQRGGFGQ